MGSKRWLLILTGLACLLSPLPLAQAQDGATLDDVRKMYKDALVQLKAAQDRKSELANENTKLTARVAELEKQNEDYKRQSAGFAEQTFFLRSRYAAWQTFMKQYPELLERWEAFLRNDSAGKAGTLPHLDDDGEWPLDRGEG